MKRIASHLYFRAISDIQVVGGVTDMSGDEHLDIERLEKLLEASQVIGDDRCWEAIKLVKESEDMEEAFQVLRVYLTL